ncbi:hypothetical protein [Pseudomonas kuykendallii]|uniref:Uncharacterized protein n=1 Tax=Pseudomonas kuykendallii TaxID=1007099 RepID=A0A2W5EQ32_9PSED|nr:hypothetical protein [Pseudomonas kuykendallii]PZP20922.1 MAG: hypothetical protein DI599_20815 [Pseudomonas kuykendallii]PZQ44324.1 MAG: hypothetical protein DI559_01515 [Pseudomonas oleovorans]
MSDPRTTPHERDGNRDTGNAAQPSQSQEQSNGNVSPTPRTEEKSGNVAQKRPYVSGNRATGLDAMANDPNRSGKRH